MSVVVYQRLFVMAQVAHFHPGAALPTSGSLAPAGVPALSEVRGIA